MEIMEFTCPRCGTHEFEQNEKDGICHGYLLGRACSFRFKSNDPLYFRATGRRIPNTVVGRSVR